MSKTYCNMIKKGLFVSHRGVGLCCANKEKHNLKPSEFWTGITRSTALHNMENDLDVKGCEGCYHNESLNIASVRQFFHSYNDLQTKSLPTLLDLDFSNFCNLKCVMCNEDRSSEWAKDQGKNNNGISTISQNFIDDLIHMSGEAREITIQGGEPSIMEEYEYYFENLHKKNLTKNINLSIITNLTNLNNKFYNLLEKFRSVRLSVSIDAFGLANDYIRWPSKFEQIEKNLIKLSYLHRDCRVEIFNTLNILSLFNYGHFLHWCKKIEQIYDAKKKYFGVVGMKVTSPLKFSPFIAPQSLKEKFQEDVRSFFIKNNLKHNANFKTENSLLIKHLLASHPNEEALQDLQNTVKDLDNKRKSKITNYIPDFHKYI